MNIMIVFLILSSAALNLTCMDKPPIKKTPAIVVLENLYISTELDQAFLLSKTEHQELMKLFILNISYGEPFIEVILKSPSLDERLRRTGEELPILPLPAKYLCNLDNGSIIDIPIKKAGLENLITIHRLTCIKNPASPDSFQQLFLARMNKFYCSSPCLDPENIRRTYTKKELDEFINNGLICIQPKFRHNPSTGKWIGYESIEHGPKSISSHKKFMELVENFILDDCYNEQIIREYVDTNLLNECDELIKKSANTQPKK